MCLLLLAIDFVLLGILGVTLQNYHSRVAHSLNATRSRNDESNVAQAMQPTASEPTIYGLRVYHPRFSCVAVCIGLAAADLVSRWATPRACVFWSRTSRSHRFGN
jgi:hypothetical protein